MKKVVTLLNCIDGLFQDAGLNYVRNLHEGFIVDNITFPGMDNVFIEGNDDAKSTLEYSIDISISRGSKVIYLAGHSNCTGNVKCDGNHLIEVEKSVQYLKDIYPNLSIKGIFIEIDYNVKEIG
ncbi:MAG: hypothetical protein QM489_02890 [Candidatus Izemoplasma sp.]